MQSVRYTNFRNDGFTLVELMVALAIGLFLIAGVFTAYVNGKRSQDAVNVQVDLVDNTRFALDMISSDLRLAGMYGAVNSANVAGTNKVRNAALLNVPVPGECQANWVIDWQAPVMAFDTGNQPAGYVCLTNYSQGDVFELRYTLQTPVAAFQANGIYINSDVSSAEFFQGNASPNLSASAQNFSYVASAYYIAAFTNNVADGVPSLRRVTLQADGTVVNEVLLSGVEDMQIQFGVGQDTNGDGNSDTFIYSDPTQVTNWQLIETAQIWLVMRSPDADMSLNTVIPTVRIAGNDVTIPAGGINDGIRRVVISTVSQFRNI